MGRQQLEAFYKKLAEDKALKDQVTEIKGDIDTVYQGIVKIARANGFDITAEDIRALHAEDQELDDEQLDMVAGGGCTSVCGEICGMFLGHWMGRQ